VHPLPLPRRPDPDAARGGSAGRGTGRGRLGGRRRRPATAAAEHPLTVAGPRQAWLRSGADAVRARRGADRGRRGARGVLLRAARRVHGRVHDGHPGHTEERRVLRPALQPVAGRGVPAGPLGGGGRVRDREPAGRGDRPLHRRRADAGPGPAGLLRAGDAGARGPAVPVLVPGPRCPRHRRRASCGAPPPPLPSSR
jgi:hypothetical protein